MKTNTFAMLLLIFIGLASAETLTYVLIREFPYSAAAVQPEQNEPEVLTYAAIAEQMRGLNCLGKMSPEACSEVKSLLNTYAKLNYPSKCQAKITSSQYALLLYYQIQRESRFNPKAVSPKGAKGISQFMPGAAGDWGVHDRYDVRQSIQGQARYMQYLMHSTKCDYKLALAGYNAGLGNVNKYGGIPPFTETQEYIREISGNFESAKRGNA
ncbi:MAG: lytic transglycosylase domain-containing protein [Candidatus Micrarchaeota archaeon]